jgi:hypothetical protein
MASKSTNGHGHVNGNGNGAMEIDGDGEDKRTRFRRVYMETLVKGFGKDLEKIREVCANSSPYLLLPIFSDCKISHQDNIRCHVDRR